MKDDEEERIDRKKKKKSENNKMKNLVSIDTLEIFDPKKVSIYDWIERFNLIYETNGWKNETRRLVIWNRLDKKIALNLESVPNIDMTNTELVTLINILVKLYGEELEPAFALPKLSKITQNSKTV